VTDNLETYEGVVETVPAGHVITENDKEVARQKFIELALANNPNGIQGDPELLGSTHVVGQTATWTFRVALPQPVEDPLALREGGESLGEPTTTGDSTRKHKSTRRPTENPGSTSALAGTSTEDPTVAAS